MVQICSLQLCCFLSEGGQGGGETGRKGGERCMEYGRRRRGGGGGGKQHSKLGGKPENRENDATLRNISQLKRRKE